MSQPPYPPQGGNESGGDQPGSSGWNSPGGSDDPTRKFESPAAGGQRDETRQFGQPQFGQPQYGQQPGQPPYGQPQYGQPQYGQQPGQPPYGQPWGPPGGPGGREPKSNKNTVIALVVAAVVVLAAIGAGLFFLLRQDDPDPTAATDTPASVSSTTSEAPSPESSPSEEAPSPEPPSDPPASSGSIPPATVTPDGLGDDPVFDQLAQECYDGDMQACDDLWSQSEPDSLYELYGGTCAGRQDVSESDTVFCTVAFPGD
jgi:hypothetical protein